MERMTPMDWTVSPWLLLAKIWFSNVARILLLGLALSVDSDVISDEAGVIFSFGAFLGFACSNSCSSCMAICRDTRSVPPPAAQGQMIVIGLEG